MTSKTTTLTQQEGKLERFPEYPPRDDMQNWIYLYDSGILSALTVHFADAPNVTVASEVPVTPVLPISQDVRIPDMLMVRDGDRALMEAQNGYVIDHQGKVPDFALEVASPTTGAGDYTAKRLDYERYGVGEYWRFDASGGEYHDVALAGDLLVDGRYEPIAIEMLEEGMLRGYSEVLGLYVCWERGELRFYDPMTESYLLTQAEERTERIDAESRADQERAGRILAESRATTAESRVAELEAELQSLREE